MQKNGGDAWKQRGQRKPPIHQVVGSSQASMLCRFSPAQAIACFPSSLSKSHLVVIGDASCGWSRRTTHDDNAMAKGCQRYQSLAG